VRKQILNMKSGFTLVELLIATAVLLVAITGVLIAFRSPAVLNEMARDTTIATQDASRVIEQMRVTKFSDIQKVDPYWDSWAASNGAKNLLPLPLPNGTNETVAVSYTAIDPSLLEVRVTITWTRRSRSRNIRLTTRIANVGTS